MHVQKGGDTCLLAQLLARKELISYWQRFSVPSMLTEVVDCCPYHSDFWVHKLVNRCKVVLQDSQSVSPCITLVQQGRSTAAIGKDLNLQASLWAVSLCQPTPCLSGTAAASRLPQFQLVHKCSHSTHLPPDGSTWACRRPSSCGTPYPPPAPKVVI